MLDDNLPELAESFQVTLVSAESGDGKRGSTPTSGASIDSNNSVNSVTVRASDHPYGTYLPLSSINPSHALSSSFMFLSPTCAVAGLLQFQPSPPGEGLISPALQPAHITVHEEDGQVRLPVARAQGLLGRVMVGYRTTPFTASSPEDYEVTGLFNTLMQTLMALTDFTCPPQDSEGMLDFLPGERLKFITVTIVDNPVPELEKIFRVELYNADGGGERTPVIWFRNVSECGSVFCELCSCVLPTYPLYLATILPVPVPAF